MSRTFLRAEWRKLLMANYVVDPELLDNLLPPHTSLDLFNDKCYVSLVGFMFMNTQLLGVRVPFHVNFEEVNLRFYVRYNENGEIKRGVVFVKEIVPKPALSMVANLLYHEHYVTCLMHHEWKSDKESLFVSYSWKMSDRWNTLNVRTLTSAFEILPGSEEEFITEHYWGYTKISDSATSEYGVEHPRWQVYKTQDYHIDIDFESNYGSQFAILQNSIPASVFLAEGSSIAVKMKRKKIN